MRDAVFAASHAEHGRHVSRRRSVAVLGQVGELDAVVGQDGVGPVGNGFDQGFEEGGRGQPVGFALELGKGGRRLFSTVLVRFEHLEREWEWTMRPRVARALEQIGWCGGRQGLTASQELQKYEETYRELPETTKKRVIESRLGQGYFRANLLSYWKRCALTGCRALDILKASHIKPWRESTNPERLDRFNGLLLTPNLDALFDRGLMTFQDDGAILVSPDVDRESLPSLGIDQRMRIRRLAPRHLKYLRFHREKVFIKG